MIKRNYNIFYLAIFLLLLSYAFIEGGRMPNLWSINYFLPNFFEGFYRRALPGTILYFLGDLRFNYYMIASVQFATLASLLIWGFFIFKKNALIMLVISLYLVSPAGGYLFHEVGYIEQLLYLLLFISVAIFNNHKYISVTIMSCSMFVHEMALLITLPIFFTYIFLCTNSLKESILCSLPPLVSFLFIYIFFQTVSKDTVQTFTQQIMQHSNYLLREDYYSIFTNSFAGTRNKLYYNYSHANNFFLLFSIIALTFLATYKLPNINNRILTSLLVLVTAISPLILGFLGWDTYRWFFLSFTSLTIVFVLTLLHSRVIISDINLMQPNYILYFVFYILFISNIKLEYFDGYKQRPINFDSVKEIRNEVAIIPTI